MEQLAALEHQAVELARRGEFTLDARSVNEAIVRLAPANEGAWTRLARCCIELGQLDDAMAALDAALQVNPANRIAHNLQIDVSKRRAGAIEAVAPRRRASAPRAAGARKTPAARTSAARAAKPGTIALGGFGRAEFNALAQLAPQAAAESLSARFEPLLMALNDRPFAAKVTEARNRAGHAGVRLFRRGSIQPRAQGSIHVHQQGGRWEPQLNIGLFAAPQWGRDCLAAGIGFELASAGSDDKADAGRERLFAYFEVFQRLLAASWRVHLEDWLRTSGGFIQLGDQPPATGLLPGDAVASLIAMATPAEHGWVFCGRWLFADRGDDIAILNDAPRLLRWVEGTFTDLLPLWGDVYRGAYRS